MNAALADAQALLCIGFGFNDDHLQGVIKRRLAAGMPAIIVTRDPTPNIEQLLGEHPHVIAVFRMAIAQFVTGMEACCRVQNRSGNWMTFEKFVE